MDAYEATKTVMSRIQALDPDNSSKIMGSILIQDQGDKEMIRLAFCPDPFLLSYVNRAKTRLGLSSNPPTIFIPNNGGGEYQFYSPGLDPVMSPGGVSDWRPCMYGFCKNGGGCNFLHGADPIDVGSPGKSASVFDEMLRMKPLQQQWIADMGCYDAYTRNRRLKLDLGLTATANSVAHQIYLTFPAESTFKEEDVTTYFGMFGPVQDVRIPYQQKRMFGFVTFVYPETVKLILAKGNPHFVCDSRVLVKPYKEKGKFKEKKHYAQQCLSPSGVDAEHLDTPFGPRMWLSPQDMMLRRKLEQEAEMQHAIELESRRMMSLQLMDSDNENHNYHYLNGLPSDILYSSPGNSEILMNCHLTSSSDSINQENSEEFDGGQDPSVPADEKKFPEPEATEFSANNNMGVGNKLHRGNSDDSDVHESLLEHNLPNNLFTSPTKSAAENHCGFSESNTDSAQITTSSSSNDPHLPGSSPPQHSFSETILPSHAKFFVWTGSH